MFSVNNISMHFSGMYIFNDVSFLINGRDRIGLVGKNGAGKTTLIRIITRDIEPETGQVVIPSGKTVGYMPQEMNIFSTDPVFTEALSTFSEALELEEKIRYYSDQIVGIRDHETHRYASLVEKLIQATEHFRIIGGSTKEADTEKVLMGLGFTYDDFKRPLNTFSGGWQMRVELAKILLRKPDLLLLDEPTNHLDIDSIQWLEQFLIDYPGAVVLVSHDRALLDNVTTRTIEISLGKIYDYKTSYSGYVILREQQREKQLATYSNQQRQIAQIERFIERFRYKNTKSKQVQSRIKTLEKIEVVEIDVVDKSSIHFVFPPAQRSGKVVFEARSLTKKYDDLVVLNALDFVITRDEKVAFVGKNGEGKSTLSKIIAGVIDYSGHARLGHNIRVGYFAQNQAELLDQNKTVFDTIDEVAVGDMRSKVRDILGSFLFGGDTIYKWVKSLSGGEKSRLAIARLLLSPANLLILDEPTNHLDMQSKDIFKDALLQFQGTLVIVSHDRDFLQGLTNKVFEFRNHTIKQYFGDIYDFLESRKIDSLRILEASHVKEQSRIKNESLSENKLKYEQKKLFEREYRKLANRISKCESEIQKIEKEIKVIDEYFSSPEKYATQLQQKGIFEKYALLKQRLEEEMKSWEELNLQIEEIENQHKTEI
ncbi:MAG: ABC-F family ATP-binding cassette domain-containing protein [Bacteroidetes bacterium]|nr:ABC-F family ATP-binding cassette domain-containing protein [Bacteroidota bacterium]